MMRLAAESGARIFLFQGLDLAERRQQFSCGFERCQMGRWPVLEYDLGEFSSSVN